MAAHLLRKFSNRLPIWMIKFLGSIWMPFLGSGISVLSCSPDYRKIKVVLKKRWYNSNYVGTAFGGSIFSMTDPFYMLMIMQNLGSEYIVWDKAASIKFIKPGRTNLYAEFEINEDDISFIKQKLKTEPKLNWEKTVKIYDIHHELISEVKRTVYIRACTHLTRPPD